MIPGGVNSPVRAFTVGGRHPAVHHLGPGLLADRRRRQPLRRPGLLVGPDDPGPRAPRRRRGRAACRVHGAVLRRADAGGDRARRRDHRPGAARRAGPAGQLRHRGHHERGPAGPRLHRPRRRSSSSPAATTATSTRCWPTPAPASRRWACRPRPGSPARRPPTRSCCPTTTSRPSSRRSPGSATRSPAIITEACPGNMGTVAPLPGYNAALRRITDDARRAADQRRGDDRIPGQPVRLVRAGAGGRATCSRSAR